LRKRYGADYQVITARSVKAALDVLGGLRDTGRQVSLVLADQWLPGATGTELLARVRQLHPSARRVLLITWGDQSSLEPMLRATVLGDIDAYVVRPGPSPDERFHRFVTEQLDEWGRSNLPGLEAVRVVGEEWAARSHELRELVGTPDTVRPIGIKGIGEIGVVGVSAAIANAAYHATGRRI